MIYHLDWVAGTCGILTTYLTGKVKWQGPAISVANGALMVWINYHIGTWGFIPVCLIVMGLNAKNAREWRRRQNDARAYAKTMSSIIDGVPLRLLEPSPFK